MKIIGFLFCFLLWPVELYASSFTSPEKVVISSELGQKILQKLENYLNSITTIKADFIQSASNGSYSEGYFYLQRPGKMRIDYKPPMKVEIVADGRVLVYHDLALEQITYMNLASSPAGILLNEKISFTDPLITIKELIKFANAFEVTVVHQKEETAAITLVFVDEPLTLKQWRIHDAHNIITAISLYNIEKAVALDPKLFKFKDPRQANPY